MKPHRQPGPRVQRGFRRSTLMGGIALCLWMIMPAGCGTGGPDQAMDRYLARLARTLSVEREPVVIPTHPALPPAGKMHLAIPPGKLDALDFLALRGCALQVTIGKRNSSLGRLARDSQRLLLELEYLQLAPACAGLLRERGETDLAAALEQAWELKRRQLPARVFNATLGGAEYRAFWRAPAHPDGYPGNTSSAVITSLEAINAHVRRWLAGDFKADNRAFEILLWEVNRGDGGALLRALARQAGGLGAADRTLQRQLERGPLCRPGFRPAAADILDNVVRKYFIAAVQPRSAALHRRYHGLLPAITGLEQLLDDALPAAYRDWRLQRDQALAGFLSAPRAHVGQLQTALRPCAKETASAG